MARGGFFGFARGILDEEPKQDSRPWAWGCEPELSSYDQAVSWALFASDRRNLGRSGGNWLRRLDDAKPRHLAWLRCKEVAWWDAKAQRTQDKADQGDALAQVERDAWAEHFRLIGESPGLVADQVWENVPCYAPMDVVWENAPAPNELHAALRKMSLGTAAGEDEVTAELLKLGGENLWEAVVKLCREQWLILTEAAPGAEAIWPDEWCVGLVPPSWKTQAK